MGPGTTVRLRPDIRAQPHCCPSAPARPSGCARTFARNHTAVLRPRHDRQVAPGHSRATTLLSFGPGTTVRLRPDIRAQPQCCPWAPARR
ncbi:hypothetical protein ACFPM0_10465 [Pseudonocardia sulfidoxydans]|uniref:hypothetical protein n=1 Tax=Pseudonocardia sulfidoxydans TaxID=54011 RepID=UPI0036195CAA